MSRASRIVIGTMSWSTWGKELSIAEQAELIEFCLQEGNNRFDGADIYGDYSTEADFGQALKESRIDREQIEIISKCGIQLEGGSRNTGVKHYNYSSDYIIWSAEETLKKLQTDYIDLYLLHRPSPLMDPDEIAGAITKLQEAGKIRHFGVSNFSPSQVDLIRDRIDVEANQIQCSLTHTSPMWDGTLDQMIRYDMEPLLWNPLGNVFRSDQPEIKALQQELETMAEKYGLTEAGLLIAWLLKHPAGCAPVIGTTQKDRIKAANQALDIDLELEDWFKLLKLSRGEDVA